MSKVASEYVQSPLEASFLIRKFGPEAFEAPYHSHQEYELTLIIEGRGKRYIGSHIGDFEAGDLVLLGSGLPHCWKLEETAPKEACGALVFHFTYDFLGKEFWTRPENRSIQNLLKHASGGIQFKSKSILQEELMTLYAVKDRFERMLGLLKVLNRLAALRDFRVLDYKDSLQEQSENQGKRIKKVFAYIVENFHNRLALQEVANLVNMTPQSFCKYFKKTTGKTFIQVAIDYRIDYASSQLTGSEKSISEVCYESGFGDRSYFSKKFKEKTGFSPSGYRKAYRKL